MGNAKRTRDELLVLRAQVSAAGLEALVKRWHPALWRHAYRLTENKEAAWDLVQETWCVVVRRLHTLEDPAAFPSWVFRILTNRHVDWLRKEGRRREAMADYTQEATRTAEAAPAGDDRIERALRRLNRNLRLLVQLYYEESFSVREISEITGLKEGSVKSRLHRARQELKRHLEELSDAE